MRKRFFMVATLLFCAIVIEMTCATVMARQLVRDFQTEQMLYKMVTHVRQLIDEGKNLQAKQIMEHATRYDPSSYSGSIHEYLSIINRNLGNVEGAIQEAHLSMKFDPDRRTPPYHLALCYKDVGNFEQSMFWLNKFIERPTNSQQKKIAEKVLLDLQSDKDKMSKYDPNKTDYLDDLIEEKSILLWPQERMPLKVYIQNGEGIKGYRPIFNSFIEESLGIWSRASGGKISYRIVTEPSGADLKVQWTSNPVTMMENNRERGEAGITRLRGSHGEEFPPSIADAEITIQTISSWYKKGDVSDDEIKGTCLHEVGHAMGLSGHSRNVSDIMYFGRSNRQMVALTKRDKATISRMYGNYPVVAPTGQQPAQFQAQQYPAQQFQAQQYPVQQFPAQQYPAQQYPAQQYPAQQYPAQQYPAQQYPAQQYPAQQYPAQQFQQYPAQQYHPGTYQPPYPTHPQQQIPQYAPPQYPQPQYQPQQYQQQPQQ